jgi:hypothetical protein
MNLITLEAQSERIEGRLSNRQFQVRRADSYSLSPATISAFKARGEFLRRRRIDSRSLRARCDDENVARRSCQRGADKDALPRELSPCNSPSWA